MDFGTKRLRRAESLTDQNPTQEQKATGDYRKGKVLLKGFPIIIENPQGSIRSGVDDKGNVWESKLNHTYGYFENTEGYDGDEVDVFIGPEIDKEFDIYIVDQVNEFTKKFDEHKVMFGFKSEGEAVRAYLSNYHKGWIGFGGIMTLSISDFRLWLNNKKSTKQPIKIQNKTTMISKYVNVAEVPKEKINIIKLEGEVLVDQTLNNLIKQAGDIKSGETLVLEIASPGGSVEEGIRIMLWLEWLSSQDIQIITVVTANAYSIASLIMLAADIKLISRHAKVMVHNPMVPELTYVNANELEKQIISLRELEGFMYDLYTTFTGLDESEIKLLMDNETYLSPHEAVQKGFADRVVNIKQVPYEMVVNPEKTVNMSKTVNVLNQVIAKIQGKDIVNQLYYDNKGGAIEIYQADPSQYQVGDRVSKDEGEIQLADGSVLVVKEGKIEDIKIAEITQPDEEIAPATEEEVIPTPEVDAVDENASTEEIVAPVEETIAADFNVGDAPSAPTTKSKDAMPSSVIETTESTVTTKETVAQAQDEPVAEVVEEMVEKPVEATSIPQPETVSLEAFKALVAKVEEMQATINSQQEAMKAQTEKEMNFQTIATEAIETLAKNTSSAFKPEARVSSVLKPNAATIGKNSIFQRLKAANPAVKR